MLLLFFLHCFPSSLASFFTCQKSGKTAYFVVENRKNEPKMCIFARFMNNNTKRKTGLYFGSFNPIHIGHLIIAEYMIEHSDLQEIWFVVSPCNPLKKKSSLLNDRQRLYMVNLAIEDDARFRASDIEFSMPQPSYTCHTLVRLTEKYPQREFALIMGEDNLQTIDKWLNYQWIMENYDFYVYPRPGYDAGDYKNGSRIHFVDAPQLQLSSTMIRDSLRQKKSVRYALHPKVYQYLDEMNFYK